jgi:hypothetical protein
MNIHAVVISRNDWGPLTVAISHALQHVDVVHALNHGSDDQTAHGLTYLKMLWGDRLNFYSTSQHVPFDQSLLTNIMAARAEAQGANWIYVFDSDEFLLNLTSESLREKLANVDSQVVALRYPLRNYISPTNFDKLNLDHFLQLCFKSVPSASYHPRKAWESINAGSSSFYDVPFPPKLIYRANSGLMITDGAHGLRWTLSGQNVAPCLGFEVAHLPLISYDTLKRKSARGAEYIKNGAPRDRGWQSQMIHQFEKEGRLDWFWTRHSISDRVEINGNPDHTVENSLVRALTPVIQHLKRHFGGAHLGFYSGAPLRMGSAESTQLAFDDVFQLCGFFDHRIKGFLANMKKSG